MWKSILRGAAALAVALWPVAGEAQGLEGENLLTGIPDGFVVGYQATQDNMEMYEFVPEGETVEEWSVMVTVQIFHGLASADGDAFASNIAELWQGACAGSEIGKLTDGVENGYAITVWSFACPLNNDTGKPETMWLKAISGADALYSVQYAYRAVASEERAIPAMDYLVRAAVCDTRLPEKPCPAGM